MNCPKCQQELISKSIIDNEQQLYCEKCEWHMGAWKICECGGDVIKGVCECGKTNWKWKLPNEV